MRQMRFGTILLLVGLSAQAWAGKCPKDYANFKNKYCFSNGYYWALFQGGWWQWVDNYNGYRVLRFGGKGPGADQRNNRLVDESQIEDVDPTPGLTAQLVPPARPPYEIKTAPPETAQQDGWIVQRTYTGQWDQLTNTWVPGGGKYSDWEKVKPIEQPKPAPQPEEHSYGGSSYGGSISSGSSYGDGQVIDGGVIDGGGYDGGYVSSSED